MKKIISIMIIALVGITIIPKTLVNEKHVVLESTTSVYTKEEVDNLLSIIRTNITNNTNELTNIKSELTALQNSLKDYALKTSLNTTNSNIDGLNTIVENNTARIEALENSSLNIGTMNLKVSDMKEVNLTGNYATSKNTATATYTPSKDCYYVCHAYIATGGNPTSYVTENIATMPGSQLISTNLAVFPQYVNMGYAHSGETITCSYYVSINGSWERFYVDLYTDEN